MQAFEASSAHYNMNILKEVILVNESDEVIGSMEKMEAHRKGVLHRAFSIFIFNNNGDMLLQQRADEKYHSGGLWTNACCSHPSPGKPIEEEAARRLSEEMGFTTKLQPAFSFIYKSVFENGLTEHEFDHVFTGIYEGPVHPDAMEVKHWNYFTMDAIRRMINDDPGKFTAWFRIAFPLLEKYLSNEG